MNFKHLLSIIFFLNAEPLYGKSNKPMSNFVVETNSHSFFTTSIDASGFIPVNILLLLPANDTYKFSLSKVLASLSLAIQDIKFTDYGSRFEVNLISDNCDCGSIRAPVNAMENIYRIRNHTKVFQAVFGPMCD